MVSPGFPENAGRPSPFAGALFQTIIAAKNRHIWTIFKLRWMEREDGVRDRAPLAAIRGKKKVVWDIGRLTIISPGFSGGVDHPSPLGGTLFQTLIADNDCSIWPIF